MYLGKTGGGINLYLNKRMQNAIAEQTRRLRLWLKLLYYYYALPTTTPNDHDATLKLQAFHFHRAELVRSLSPFGPVKRKQTTLGIFKGLLGLSMALSSSHPPLLHTPLGALPLLCGVTGIWRTTPEPGADTSTIRHRTEVNTMSNI